MCCLVFIVFLVALVGVFGFVASQANLARLYRGLDEDGKLCGIDKTGGEFLGQYL
jgi:hypothetical protein